MVRKVKPPKRTYFFRLLPLFIFLIYAGSVTYLLVTQTPLNISCFGKFVELLPAYQDHFAFSVLVGLLIIGLGVTPCLLEEISHKYPWTCSECNEKRSSNFCDSCYFRRHNKKIQSRENEAKEQRITEMREAVRRELATMNKDDISLCSVCNTPFGSMISDGKGGLKHYSSAVCRGNVRKQEKSEEYESLALEPAEEERLIEKSKCNCCGRRLIPYRKDRDKLKCPKCHKYLFVSSI